MGRLGGFRILKILGHGGMGVVFLGEDPKLGRKVAIKAMLPHLADSKTSQARFLRKARRRCPGARSHCSHLAGWRGSRCHVYRDAVLERRAARRRLKRDGKLPIQEVLRIGREIAKGLSAAHTAGLIRRDIKPANIWLEDPEGRVVILDLAWRELRQEKRA